MFKNANLNALLDDSSPPVSVAQLRQLIMSRLHVPIKSLLQIARFGKNRAARADARRALIEHGLGGLLEIGNEKWRSVKS